MLSFFAIGLTLGFVLAVPLFGWWWGERIGSHLNVAQTFLSIAALAGAAAWYFIARPDVAKLKFEQKVEAAPVGAGDVLLLSELQLQNVGAQTLRLQALPARMFVQRVTPLEVAVADDGGAAASIRPADTWVALASMQTSLTSEIEAGEAENLYFRSTLKCVPGLRVYWTTWVEKPRDLGDRLMRRPSVWWVKQTFVDLTDACGSSPKPAAPRAARATKR